MTILVTRIEDCAVLSGRWVRVGNVEVTALPLVDTAHSTPGGQPLFARLNYTEALQVADRMGARLVSRETLEAMRLQASTIFEPFTLPADDEMSSIERCTQHDVEMWRRLDALQDDEDELVLGIGKHLVSGAPPGRAYLMGWWTRYLERSTRTRRGAGWVQQGAAPGTAGPHSATGVRDYATTTILERDPGGVRRAVGEPSVSPLSVVASAIFEPARRLWGAALGLLTPSQESHMPRSTLRVGARGPLVVELQRMLGVATDGIFGPATEAAVRAVQGRHGLTVDGVVGPATWAAIEAEPFATPTPPTTAPKPRAFAAEFPCVTSVRPDKHTRRRPGRVDLVVLHTAECGETSTAAEAVAGYLVSTDAASAHFVVDNDSTVQQVPLGYVAGAAPGANDQGVQIEMCGRAAQTPEQWADAYSIDMLKRASTLVAQVCERLDVPPIFVDAAGLIRGERGVTTHAEVSKAFKRSTHTDPGKHFPMATFLAAVRSKMR
jgi:lysozyme family protein